MNWLLIAAVTVAVAWLVGARRERLALGRLLVALAASPPPQVGVVRLGRLAGLPPPVQRYFRHVLADGQAPIARATLHQAGELRTGTATSRWLAFTAVHVAVPGNPGFIWNAAVRIPLTHIRVIDSFVAGTGAGRVSLASALRLAGARPAPELDAGALHRYLAEAVWYPTALLPEAGVEWTPVDEHTALATLAVGATSVSLEFHFNDRDEVTGIYSEGRYGLFDGEYRRRAWEGHFARYREHEGMRIPTYGEVGWYGDNGLELVWRGHIVDAAYEFAGPGAVGD